MQGAYVKRINASPGLHIRSNSNRLKKPIKLKEYDYSIDLQGNYLNFGQPSCFHHVSKEHPKNSICQNIDVGRDSSRSVTRDINHRSISPLSKERERGSAMKLRKTVKSSHNVGRLKLNRVPIAKPQTSYHKSSISFHKSHKRVSYYDTNAGSAYFGNTIKDKQHLDFNELIDGQEENNFVTMKVNNNVKNNLVPNNYRSECEENKIKTNSNQAPKISKQRNPSLLKAKYARKSKSVLLRRKHWNTSSKKGKRSDSPLDLSKKEFGQEYRAVLDKLLEPKLPNNRELKCDPSYEYAQRAMKLRIMKKVDLIKNKGFLRLMRRKTTLADIRMILSIMNSKGKRKFSMLEVDYNLGIK
ncbi:unnamed protein product [Moneuplotes crassus]|uniref:Uncharacterized protein n=1 Tax=Euplotes crassus TaxID=5936 RepID=A0AAD1UJA7_EUPCR|nr:unnamed protein product [Moneuplotes crassus]